MAVRRRTIACGLAAGLLALPLAGDLRADDPLIVNVIRADTTLAVQEHSWFLNCSSLDPELHDQVSRQWREDVDKATKLLADGPKTQG